MPKNRCGPYSTPLGKVAVSVRTVGGSEVATLTADPAWRLKDLLQNLPGCDSPLTQPRLWLGEEELCGERSLADLGAAATAELTLVLSRRLCVLTCSLDWTAKLWCKGTGQCLRTYYGHSEGVTSAAFSPDEEQGKVLTASCDHTAKLWCTASGRCIQTLQGHTDIVYSASFSYKGDMVLTASNDRTAKLWCVATGRCRRTLRHRSTVWSAIFTPEDKFIVTGSNDGDAKLWSADGADCLRTFEAGGAVCVVALSPSAQELLTAGSHPMRLWSIDTGELLRTFDACGTHSAAFSPDGQAVLVGEALLSLNTGERLRTFAGHVPYGVASVAFSAEGDEVLTAGRDGTAKLWRAAGGLCLRSFEDHRNWVSSAVFSR